jgi:hypothetical protein
MLPQIGSMFTYIALPDPSKQFRLLSFQPSSTNTLIDCQLDVYDIADSLPYYAISYHYGDPSAVDTILVDGQETQVNRNCWHALNQVRAQSRAGHFWVDSVCINQSDVKEKSLQVHRIAAIFSGADEVWACFGPASGDSDFLLNKLSSFPAEDPAFTVDTPFAERSDDLQRRTVNWMISLGNDFGRFASALKTFGARPFFSRMWIYQEVFLASNMKMLFGAQAANMQALQDVTKVCSSLMMSYRPQSEYDYKDAQLELNELLRSHDLLVRVGHDSDLSALRLLVHQLQPRDRTGKAVDFGDVQGIVQVQEAVQRLQCQDPRDKIFAIISMFGSSCTIMPDFGISCFELALRVLREYAACENDRRSVKLAMYLCHNLRLDLQDTDVDLALARNQAVLPTNRYGHGSVLPHSIDSPPMLLKTTSPACQVMPNRTGQMTAPFISPQTPYPSHKIDAKTIVANGQPVAIATCDFDTGDWIAPLSDYTSDYYNGYCVGLVFRLRESNTYDIVGEVAFFPSCRPCVSWDNCRCQFGPEFHTHYHTDLEIGFDCEELLLCTIRLRGPYDEMRQETRDGGRGGARLPDGPPMNWRLSCAVRRDSTVPLRTVIA